MTTEEVIQMRIRSLQREIGYLERIKAVMVNETERKEIDLHIENLRREIRRLEKMSVDKKAAMKRIIELTHSENWQEDKEIVADELITKVEQWAKDKGLNQADPKAQFLKVAEEFGEIASAMARSNDELFKDSVGDVIVTLIILSMQKGTNVQECLELAYNEIKGRTGEMVDGVFVKSSDLEGNK